MQLPQILALHGLEDGGQEPVEAPPGQVATLARAEGGRFHDAQNFRGVQGALVKSLHGQAVHLDAGLEGGLQNALLLRKMGLLLVDAVAMEKQAHPKPHKQGQGHEQIALHGRASPDAHSEIP